MITKIYYILNNMDCITQNSNSEMIRNQNKISHANLAYNSIYERISLMQQNYNLSWAVPHLKKKRIILKDQKKKLTGMAITML